MSVHFSDWNALSVFFPIGALVASLLGSGHCVAMCGGIMVSVTRDKFSSAFYHLGRLLGYVSLGSLAGVVGKHVLSDLNTSFIPHFTAILLSSFFVWMGVSIWRRKPLHLFSLPPQFFIFLNKLGRQGPLAVGLLSAFLPCGWLHTFILSATALQNPVAGGVYLFFFWLGTLPVLSLTSFSAIQILRSLSNRTSKFVALLLIGMGLFSIGTKVSNLYTQGKGQAVSHCSHHHE